MSKWHNGPNGPGICRARKGNCPFGGQDSHFDSKEEAFIAFNDNQEEKHGLLPNVSTDEKTEFDVRATLKNGTNQSLSNFVSGNNGYQERSEYIKKVVTTPNKDAHEIVDLLNNDRRFHGEWSVSEERVDSTKLMNIDSFGNKGFLEIKAIISEEKSRDRGDSFAYNDNGVALSLSNYSHSSRDGSEGNKIYVKNLLEAGLDNPEQLVDRLNSDSRIFGEWKVEREDSDKVILETRDNWGNIDYVNIYK